ncbi:hypothetical protein LCGC14_3026100 [marine sediment metagenome]|uniref:DUF3303 domain-containing protein n=1 Tax=marine sediment metagenome TaxID=412755 RepID=A0A0F8XGX2_9ZZZZ
MLFLVKQTHTPATCPRDKGGSRVLYNPEAEGVALKAMYGAFAEHIIYYVVEADDLAAVNQFLDPGWLSCTSSITPVSEAPIQR